MQNFHVVAGGGIAAPRGPGMRGGPDRAAAAKLTAAGEWSFCLESGYAMGISETARKNRSMS